MTQVQFLAIFVRLAALYMLFQLSIYGPSLVATAFLFDQDPKWIYLAGITTIFVFCAVLLMLKFPSAVARKLIPTPDEDNFTLKLSLSEFEGAMIVLLGLFILANALVDVVYWTTTIHYLAQIQGWQERMPLEHKANMVATVFQLILGLGLVLGGSGLRYLIHKFRYGSLDPETKSSCSEKNSGNQK